MLYLRRVVGQSMLPTLRPGQLCIFVKSHRYRHGDVVLAFAEGRQIVKRMHHAEGEVLLKGDNHSASNVYVVTRQTHTRKVVAKLVWPAVGPAAHSE